MAKRSKAENEAIFWLVVVGLIGYLTYQFVETVGIVLPVVLVIAAIVGYNWFKSHEKKKRREYLLQKYGDEEIVGLIMSGSVWQGQTEEQLQDSLGNPASVDEKVLKTKTKHVWKYGHQGGNRYSTRVTVENGVVVGWDHKR